MLSESSVIWATTLYFSQVYPFRFGTYLYRPIANVLIEVEYAYKKKDLDFGFASLIYFYFKRHFSVRFLATFLASNAAPAVYDDECRHERLIHLGITSSIDMARHLVISVSLFYVRLCMDFF